MTKTRNDTGWVAGGSSRCDTTRTTALGLAGLVSVIVGCGGATAAPEPIASAGGEETVVAATEPVGAFDETPIPSTTCTLRHPHWMTPFLRSYARPRRDPNRGMSGLVAHLGARRHHHILNIDVALVPAWPEETDEERLTRLAAQQRHPLLSGMMPEEFDPHSVAHVAGTATRASFLAIVGPYAISARWSGDGELDLARDLRCETPPPSGDAPWTPMSLAEIRSEDGVASRVDLPGTIVSDQTFPDARASLARTQLHMAGEGLSMMREIRSELPTERGVESYRVAIHPIAPGLGFERVGFARFEAMMALPETGGVPLVVADHDVGGSSAAVIDGRLCQRSFAPAGEFIVVLDWCSSDDAAGPPERQRLLAFLASLIRGEGDGDVYETRPPDVLRQTRALRAMTPAVRRCLAGVARVTDPGADRSSPDVDPSMVAPWLASEVDLVALVDETGTATEIVRVPSPMVEPHELRTQIPGLPAQCVADAVRRAAFPRMPAPDRVLVRCSIDGCIVEPTS